MPRRTIHGIDPYAPGGVEALIEFNRGLWGDMQMNANAGGEPAGEPSGEPAGTPAGNEPPAGGTPPATPPAPKSNEAPKADDWDGKVESLPAAAQQMIKDLRKADGDERVAKKTLDAITKALNPDAKGDEKPTAEQLTKQLAERDTAAKQAQTELAVYKLAGKHGADADALLDSRAFLAKIAELDHTKTADVEKAIKEAVESNPKLKSVRVAGSSTADGAGGSGEKAKKNTGLGDALAGHYATN
ncbi:hypothetical protein NMP99_02740 [Glutamicibacter mishrai]|uniref:hypothetical protein n=1 Tax=Glutamicibacter mishrai TaxID=1775880 RepID=UPI0020CE72E2|nr:hypothetical protein [Glutamicibacter mishrai]UTT40245.1 hypothetical protein NMP99_02740 [Glutamicibacter mishrai]